MKLTASEHKQLAKQIETEYLKAKGWTRAIGWIDAMDLWQLTLNDGRFLIMPKQAAITITKKYAHLL